MTDLLHLQLFGSPQITYRGKAATGFVSNKVRALLIYLAVTGRAHSREALAELLWADIPATKRENLKKALSNLRNLDGVRLIEEGQHLVTLDSAHYWVDVAEFSHLANDVATTDVDTLQRAMQLYTGDFLTGFNLSLSYEFEAWALGEQTQLKQQMVAVLHGLADGYAQRNDLPPAITALRRLLQVEPWREEAHRRLMTLLVQDDQREAALVQYESCRQRLAEELAVEPGLETVALYEQIRAGKMGKGAAKGADTTAVLPLRHNLPAPTTALLGRQVELAQLTHCLGEPNIRLVTIVAPGGMGKTHLAVAVATTLLERYQQGVYFVALAPLSEPDTMVSAIAASVDYTFQNDSRSPKQQLLDYLRDKAMLLVLDNAEHLLAGVNLYTEILQAAPKLHLLVTSRERLRLSSETIFYLAGLAVSDAMHGERGAAVQLFLQTAQRVRPTFIPSAADWPTIVQLCRLVGGMPLGLILAATWIDMLTPAEIVSEISQSLDFLAADLHDLPERHRSLRAIFNATWQRLAAAERAVVQRLAVFRGGFTREAAATVAGASLSILAALSHKSLIQLQPNRRYEMHELLRQFALDTLTEQLAALRDAHSAYYCAFLAQREGDLKGARQQAAMAEIEADSENVRTAWQWAVQREQIEQLAQALDSLGLFYLWRSRLHEGMALCQLAVEHLTMISLSENIDSQTRGRQPLDARCHVRLLIWQSIFQRHLHEREAAQLALRQAQVFLTGHPLVGLDTRPEEAQLLLEQAEVIFEINLAEARALVEHSLAFYRTLHDPWRRAQGLALLGEAVGYLGELDQARQVAEEGLALRQGVGDTIGIARSLKNLAAIARNAGSFEEAEGLLRTCIAMFEELNDRGQMARGVNDLAVTFVHAGKFEAGLLSFEESLRIHHDLGLPDEPGISTNVSGFALMLLGQYEQARLYLQRALTIYCKTDNKQGIAYVLLNLGQVALAEKAYDDAQKFLQKSLAILREMQEMLGVGSAYGCLGYVALMCNNAVQAQELIRKNLEIAVDTRLFLSNMLALASVAWLWAVQGNPEKAIEIYTVALQNGHVANSRWYQDVVGQYIDAVAQTLPAEIVAAAQARGRQRAWQSTVPELLKRFQETYYQR